ncbi:MAG TPA: hypothetical protein VGQ42_08475 [Candidatus Dormibacteraeota bacterium]|jgi:hypothetical protein|nr:hypothetical protein [Candidatus Dormibacteraeota bacterium]
MRGGGRTVRPALAAVGLAVAVGGVAAGIGLHSRSTSARQAGPAVTRSPAPALAVTTPVPKPTWEAAPWFAPYGSVVTAWDSTRKQLVAYADPAAKSSETAGHIWTWDGTWREQHPATAAAPGMYVGAQLFVDLPALRGVVLLGGDARTSVGDPVGGNWLWDGTAWTPLPNAGMGYCLRPTSAAWDEHRGHLVVVASNQCSGGSNPPPPQTWTFDGHGWQRRADPPDGAVMAWDPEAQAVVLIGTSGGKAAAWNWTGTAWSRASVSSLTLPRDSRAAWDAPSGVLAIYSGAVYDGSSPARVLAYSKAGFREIPQTGYPEYPVGIVADTTHGRLLAVGVEPVPAAATPAPSDDSKDRYVLAWTGTTWAHVTYAELGGGM